MKKIVYFSCTLIILIFCSCKAKYTHNKLILDAEEMLASKPDSALILLSSIQSPESLPAADYAAWCLHYTHAQYKCFKVINSDSLIGVAIKYYDGSNLYKYSGTAYYLSGCIAELLKNNEGAMLAYEKAISILKHTGEYNTLGLAIINKGYIYKLNETYYEAYENFNNSLVFFRKSNNKKYQTYAYYEISNMLWMQDYPLDSIMYYSNIALNLARETNNSNLAYDIISKQGEMYSRVDMRKGIDYLLTGFNNLPKKRNRNAAFLAHTYSRMGMSDSAMYYLNITQPDSLHPEAEVLRNLIKADILKNNRNYKSAVMAIEKAYLTMDTVFKMKLKKQLYRIDKQFDLTEKERENAQLKISNRNRIITIGILIIGILTVLLAFLLAIIQHRKKQAINKIEQQKLKHELEKRQLEIESKKALLLSKLKQKIDITLKFMRFEQNGAKSFDREQLLDIINDHVVLKESEWPYYIDETDSIFGNKLTTMQYTYRELMPADMIVIVLICLGIDVPDSCSLLNTSKNTMYIRRKRIKKRLGIDPEADLVRWLYDYVANS